MRDKLMLRLPGRPSLRQAQKSVRWAELKGETLITLAATNPLRSIVEHNLIRVVPNYQPKYEVRFSTTAISMISAGMGVAVLPENSSQLASAVRVNYRGSRRPDRNAQCLRSCNGASIACHRQLNV
jgi:DNA-binding transcriptional LysR family regulator